jgi:hypothetical protein
MFGRKSPKASNVQDIGLEDPPRRHSLVLMSKLFMFGVSMLWVLMFLAAAVVIYDKVYDPALRVYFADAQGLLGSTESWAVSALDAFYIATIVCLGIWGSMKAFRFVGKWEPRGGTKNDSDTLS